MVLQALVSENIVGLCRVLAATLVCWSWGTGFRLLVDSERKPVLHPALLVTGYGRY
ncbi:hypothetical protein [Novosphingobium rosa]|uniref:hypothetical protein n=1 Tax=Novosphingobium rosa TaxID=76978 RepID=UPI000AE60F41|nr:hypothetical protein [Novosphingobium rosa]